MSKSNNSLRKEFLANKENKGYRHAYADESLNIAIATQIKVLREQRGLRQEDLARDASMTQPMISRYENVNYSSWSLKTLKKFALAFDVWLDVRFRPFAELISTTEEFSRESLQVPQFEEDPFFKESDFVAVRKKNEGTSKAFQTQGNLVQMLKVEEPCSALMGKSQASFDQSAPPQKVSTIGREESARVR